MVNATADTADAVDTRPEPPILLSQEQLEAHAAALAATHQLASDPSRGRPLVPLLDEDAQLLEEAFNFLSAATRTAQPIPSEDWLRDNHHVVQDQVREVRQDLPRRYYLQLPKLADGEYVGYPRVFALSRDLVAHTAGRFDMDTLVRYIRAYQRGTRAEHRRALGDPDHAAGVAGRRAAAPGRGRARGEPEPGRGAPLGPQDRRRSPRTPP